MKNPRSKGEVRRSQLITTYGVGSVVAIQDESFMVTGIDRWHIEGPDINEPRLERRLHVDGFANPPATEDGEDIPVVRFPDMYSCPACHRLDKHRFFTNMHGTQCGNCGVDLIPSRFVVACSNGHIDDFPYFRWVHAGHRPEGEQQHSLQIESAGATASLRDIVVSCTCGREMSLDGAFGRNALRQVSRCTGRRPWLLTDDEACDEQPRTLQRGASNVWFSITDSALSIPPWSEGAYKVLNRHWQLLRHAQPAALAGMIEGAGLASDGYSVDDLVEAAQLRAAAENNEVELSQEDLRNEEHAALMRGRDESSRDQDFVAIRGSLNHIGSSVFDRVMLVKRLREVRALVSFTRVMPPNPGDAAERQAPIYDEHPAWLPGIEIMGEGVFLELSEQRLRAWEQQSGVVGRAESLDANYRRRFAELGLSPDRTITARFLLVHSLAHLLINQWSLESGYPAASIRERLYVSDDNAGLLLYTGTTDSAGSLGGIVAQAADDRLDEALQEATSHASWCSTDPICIESDATGVDALNLAACHACLLLPEISCEERNVLLDRALLIGTASDPDLGYLNTLSS